MGTFAETGAEPPALGAEPPALGAEPPALGAESVTAAVDCVGADDGRAGSNVLDGDAASGFIQPRNQSIDGGCINKSTTTPMAAKSINAL
jgi:hypothetical protein